MQTVAAFTVYVNTTVRKNANIFICTPAILLQLARVIGAYFCPVGTIDYPPSFYIVSVRSTDVTGKLVT